MTSVNVTTVCNTVEVVEGAVTTVRIITAGPQGPAGGGGGGGGATDLSWDAATRTVASSTGTDAVLTEATTALPGLMSAADKALVNRAATVTVAVRNNSGVTIPKGSAVYVTGTSGTTVTVALADASTEATAAQTLGLTQDAIANNSNGTVIAVGELTGLDTSALTEGAIVWLSETTGALTTTRPTQPAHGVVLGYCVKSSPGTSGIVYVKVDNGQELDELHDVLITAAVTDQALMRAADGLWKNKTITPALIGAATTAQGALADSAVQPAALSSYLTTAAAATTYQPLDSDLTSIAALSTTTFGRSLLTQADAAAARTTLGAGTGNGTVTAVTATGLITSSGGTTPQISSSIATNSLAGRFTAGTGALEAITIGSGLAISGGALVVTAGGTGTVTSVALSLPGIFSVTGSPVTTSGTLAATLATQAANLVFAGPSSGAAAAPTFRQLAYTELSGLPTLGGAAALNVGTTAGTVAAGDDSRFAADLSYTASTRLLASSTGTDVTLPLASTVDAGLQSTADKSKLDGIEAGAQVNVPTDLSYTASTRLLASSTGTDVTLPLFTSTGAGLAPLSGGGTTNFLRADGTWAAPAGGGGSSANYQEFTSSGTWTKPANCTHYYAEATGGGGGGGSGRNGPTTTARSGGGGGAGGTRVFRWGEIADLGATESVTVGTGGTGGTGQATGNSNGNTGAAGGSSQFGSALFAPGGNGGVGGGTSAAQGGAIGFRGNATFGAGFAGNGGQSAANTTATAGTIGAYGPGGGGGGGGIGTGDSVYAAGDGGEGYGVITSATTASTGSGGAAGSAVGGAGTAGGTADGGGGGRGSITANGGAGGAGGAEGGGGGGGGATQGFVSGAGGAGGNGVVRVWSW